MIYDVKFNDGSDQVISNVPTQCLRRKYRDDSDDEDLFILPAQTRVKALYRDIDGNAINYFPGKIVQYNTTSQYYEVQFDDGDVANNILRHDVELMLHIPVLDTTGSSGSQEMADSPTNPTLVIE
jgi:hypothetical protein